MAVVDTLVHKLFAHLRGQDHASHARADLRHGATRGPGARGPGAAAGGAGGADTDGEEARRFCEEEPEHEHDEEGGAILAVTRIPPEQRERMLMMSAVVRHPPTTHTHTDTHRGLQPRTGLAPRPACYWPSP